MILLNQSVTSKIWPGMLILALQIGNDGCVTEWEQENIVGYYAYLKEINNGFDTCHLVQISTYIRLHDHTMIALEHA